ncbi:MAG: GGDEF domain-containing protein [Candidatus Omnitrophica bacterium]|nr:GGDEF domain-containing protein [Candidatus Omnitrophota bacterium]
MTKFTANFLEYLHKQNKSFFILSGILLSLLIGFVDYVILDFFMFEFYLLPVAIAVWFAGKNVGILMAFVVTLSELSIDTIIVPKHASLWVYCWNFSLNISFFIATVYLLAFLKKTLIKLEEASTIEKIINKQLNAEIQYRKEAEEKLKVLASHDELTGCVNFRSTMEFLENEIARSNRYQKSFSMIMVDVDYFKRVNDEYGHLVGNDALVAFTSVIKKSIRAVEC